MRPSSNSGIFQIKVFHIFNKKKYVMLKRFGFAKSSIRYARKKYGFLLGKKIKGVVYKTKTHNFLVDGSKKVFYQNNFFIKNKKLTKKKYNFGAITYNIPFRKIKFKFPITVSC